MTHQDKPDAEEADPLDFLAVFDTAAECMFKRNLASCIQKFNLFGGGPFQSYRRQCAEICLANCHFESAIQLADGVLDQDPRMLAYKLRNESASIQAAAFGGLRGIREFRDEYGRDLGYFACDADNATLLSLVLESGLDFGRSTGRWLGWFQTAVGENSNECIATLLSSPALRATNTEEMTSLLQSSWTLMSVVATEGLVSHGADVDVTDCLGGTPLLTACRFGATDVVRVLLDHGADAKHRDRDGHGAICVTRDRPEIVSSLMDAGAEMDVFDAAATGEERHIRKFAFDVLDPLRRTGCGECPAHFAAESSDLGALRAIAEINRESLSYTASYGVPPSYIALSKDNVKCLEIFIEIGAALVNPMKEQGPYQRAAEYNAFGCIERLYQAGLPLDQQDARGDWPITPTALEDAPEAARFILGHTRVQSRPDIIYETVRIAARTGALNTWLLLRGLVRAGI